MYIDKMTKKEKVEILKSEINKSQEEELDNMLIDLGFEYSDEYLDELGEF